MKHRTHISSIVMLTAVAAFAASGSASAESASRLLAKVEAKTRALKSFQFHSADDITFAFSEPEKHKNYPSKQSTTIDLTFMRPNLFVGEAHESNYPGTFKYVSDGKSLYFVNKKAFTKSSIDPQASNFSWYHDDLLLFYVTGSLQKAVDPPYPPTLKMLPDEVWQGENYRVIGVHVGGGVPIDYKLYVGKDLLVHRMTHVEVEPDRTLSIDYSISDPTLDPPLTPETFAFHADPDMKETAPIDYYKDNPLVAPGAVATDFSLPTPQGDRLSLRSALAGKKAVLLNFWFVGCPPCRAEHPKLEKLYSELKDKGLGLIAIDDQDTADKVAKYLHDARLDFPTVLTGPMVGIDPKTGVRDYRGPKLPDYASITPYGVHECPTNVLLDENMKVVYVALEWNEKELRSKLKELGVQ